MRQGVYRVEARRAARRSGQVLLLRQSVRGRGREAKARRSADRSGGRRSRRDPSRRRSGAGRVRRREGELMRRLLTAAFLFEAGPSLRSAPASTRRFLAAAFLLAVLPASAARGQDAA